MTALYCLGEEGTVTICLYVSRDHYHLVIPEEEMVLMRPPADASPRQCAKNAESYFLLPFGGLLGGVD